MTDIAIVTDEASFTETARSAPPGARVPVEVRVTVADPFEAYRRAREHRADGFYFETTGGQSGWGYFGIDPVERVQVGPRASPRGDTGPSIAAIDALLDRERLARGDCEVPYPCGAFGWLSYDIARELEDLPDTTTSDGLPRLQLGVFDCVAAWEEPRGDETELRVTACPIVEESPAAAYEAGVERAETLAASALGGERGVRARPSSTRQATFESECGEAAYADRVEQIQRYVRDGDTFQTNVSHRLVAPGLVHPVETFAALRRVNPAPYSALLEFPGVDLVSASPELLLDVDGDRLLTEPIAGTRPRGDTSAEDADLERDLTTDEKERAEHAMLVDLERNDLGKVSEYGTVDVAEYRRVDRYSEVMHLVSLVEGQLRDDASIADAVAAVFPGGTVTGAPKPRTMEIIDEVERTRRGPYTGSIGVFGFDGRATLNMTIRTLVRHEGEYRLRVGGGVVHDSVPEREYQETLDKARALVTAVDEALGEQGSFAVERAADPMGEVR
ncbi:anthranilate synthase component I family protein [Haloarcula nitratireducens]|uniref:anthranilate synthase n=1 Tax=Haloarcula nitratireducens TaxID=2487749 RepID=A0AAW4PHZ5_9EURY|nr:anthranilate synthase component I family protein [Halomicroarcula nitratireducens]MBX0297722.1 anthranilate synthase component I family protein [Halomicroarcula nitratireducens]